MDLRPNIEKSKRSQQWSSLSLLIPFAAVLLMDDHDVPPDRWAVPLIVYVCFLVVSTIWLKGRAVDVQAIVAKRTRFERWNALAAIVVASWIWLSSDGDWTGRVYTAVLVYAAFVFVRRSWLWRVAERDARKLEETARPLGLAGNSVDARVYEGMRRHEYVRVWIEQPLVLRNAGASAMLESILIALIFVAAAWLGWPWVAVVTVATLAWIWHSSRSRLLVALSGENETTERQTLHRMSDLAVALGPETLTPVEADLLPLEAEADLQDLLAAVRIATDDDDLSAALRMIGEAGHPETIKRLLWSLRQRTQPISPRSEAAAEAAIAMIRERHHLLDAGTLALSEDEAAGRLAIAREAGTLALPSRDGPKR